MTESEFTELADHALARIGAALDAAQRTADAGVDWSQNDGVLSIECEDGSRIIVNRHVVNREIWVAAKSGGFHFRIERGGWYDTRRGAELGAEIARLVGEQAGLAIDAVALPAD